MKRLTREERRRIQRRAANIRFLAFVLILLALGVCIGYTAARAQNACEPPENRGRWYPSPPLSMIRRRSLQSSQQTTIPALTGWSSLEHSPLRPTAPALSAAGSGRQSIRAVMPIMCSGQAPARSPRRGARYRPIGMCFPKEAKL